MNIHHFFCRFNSPILANIEPPPAPAIACQAVLGKAVLQQGCEGDHCSAHQEEVGDATMGRDGKNQGGLGDDWLMTEHRWGFLKVNQKLWGCRPLNISRFRDLASSHILLYENMGLVPEHLRETLRF